MSEQAVEMVALQLSQLGLTDDVFDAAEIAVDLAERAALNGTLEDLVNAAALPPDPTTCDPRWDR